MFPQNWGEPTGAPAIFEKQIEIKLLHPASTLESRIQATVIVSNWFDSQKYWYCMLLFDSDLGAIADSDADCDAGNLFTVLFPPE
ncbi:MAG: hypothetical protein P8X74_10455 [Reinekea sp.]